jgi:hypothetical protein
MKEEKLRIRAERLGVNITVRGTNRTVSIDERGVWPLKYETHAKATVTKLGRRKEGK